MDDKTAYQLNELLCEHLQMVETIAGVLSFNYLGEAASKSRQSPLALPRWFSP